MNGKARARYGDFGRLCLCLLLAAAGVILLLTARKRYAVWHRTQASSVKAADVLPADVTPPVVEAEDFTVTVGDTVSYKKHITVRDDQDEWPRMTIDNSQVDLDTPGEYPVICTVTDKAGNTAIARLTLTVRSDAAFFEEDPDGYLGREARKILKEIVTDDMTDRQKAYAIYFWTKRHIQYAGTSDKSNWKVGARDGFAKREGDCFTYFATAKALLTEAGIQNIDVKKRRLSDKEARHYWSLINVGSGWYHFDCTQYSYPESNFFMVTDKELKRWDKIYYPHCHRYRADGLPALATTSVQADIRYGAAKLEMP